MGSGSGRLGPSPLEPIRIGLRPDRIGANRLGPNRPERCGYLILTCRAQLFGIVSVALEDRVSFGHASLELLVELDQSGQKYCGPLRKEICRNLIKDEETKSLANSRHKALVTSVVDLAAKVEEALAKKKDISVEDLSAILDTVEPEVNEVSSKITSLEGFVLPKPKSKAKAGPKRGPK